MSEKILIIDDEETIRDTLTEVLEEEGYLVSKAVDGHDALRQMKKVQFDLVLCDVVMPGADGTEILKSIRESSPFTFVVMMTAFGTIENAVEIMKEGAIDYIIKPFRFDELLIEIKRDFRKTKPYSTNQDV
tara:strand:+ start:53 stop:445 length:393 start_codon:yes stop_codon:yes gene_type:complete